MVEIKDNDIVIVKKAGTVLFSGSMSSVPNELKSQVHTNAVEQKEYSDLPIMQGKKQFIVEV